MGGGLCVKFISKEKAAYTKHIMLTLVYIFVSERN